MDVVRVPVIVGPTGSGKSAIAMALAREVGAVIVSADSRQVYRDFDIGTAKPTADECAAVRHVGIDLVDPTVRLSAAEWASAAGQWIADAHAARRTVMIVGGTGFYVRAFFAPLFKAPPLDETRRHALDAELSRWSVEELRRWALHLDPPRASLGRTQLLRAIETALLTGRRLSALHAHHARAAQYAPRYLVIDSGRSLAQRLATRLDQMLSAGWIGEVERLMTRVPEDAPAWSATGYDCLRRHVRGEWTLDEARERTLIATRQYAKRQRTWNRHQLLEGPVTMLDPAAPGALDRARHWLGENE